MADKPGVQVSQDVASLRLRLAELEEILAKRRRSEEDLQQACGRLEAEVQRLKIELNKSQQAHQAISEELARKENSHLREKNDIADTDSPHTNVAEPLTQLATTAHTARLLRLGELAAGLAHELNQPLTAIATYAQAGLNLQGKVAFAEQEVTRLLERVAAQAERAGELNRCIRRFASRGQPDCTELDLNLAVREALILSETELKTHAVRTCLHLAENLPPTQADRIQIGQVLINLIRNAIEAMRETPVGQRVLSITTAIRDNEIETAVSDTGVGLSLDIVRDLFAAFHSTKTNGLGLGLAISRAIIQAHNGRIWVKPNPERGTTFYFALLLSKP